MVRRNVRSSCFEGSRAGRTTRLQSGAGGRRYEERKMHWKVYILECADGSLYTGMTSSIERRMREHSSGRGGRYTRAHLPVRLVHVESAADRKAAVAPCP